MTSPIVQHIHHGRLVSVYEHLKGKHRDHCLCYACTKFNPGCENNCPIAQKLYQFDVEHDLVTPVWECPEYTGQEPEWDKITEALDALAWLAPQVKDWVGVCPNENPDNCAGIDIAVPRFDQTVIVHCTIPIKLHVSAEGYEIPEDVHEALVKDDNQSVLIFGHKGIVVHSYYPARETDNG